MACAGTVAALVPAVAVAGDWGRYGYDAARHSSSPDQRITARNVSRLVRTRVQLGGTVDSAAIYVRGMFVVTTTYGRTEALNADTGKVRWRFTPRGYAGIAGSAQITNATPVASTDRTAVYAAAPDGRIRKLRLSDGKVLWATAITRDPTHEKITSSLNVFRGLVIAATGGYIGDAPPYQGHVVTMSERSGRIAHV
jgi:outer membrane protein assembly factor BamB